MTLPVAGSTKATRYVYIPFFVQAATAAQAFNVLGNSGNVGYTFPYDVRIASIYGACTCTAGVTGNYTVTVSAGTIGGGTTKPMELATTAATGNINGFTETPGAYLDASGIASGTIPAGVDMFITVTAPATQPSSNLNGMVVIIVPE